MNGHHQVAHPAGIGSYVTILIDSREEAAAQA